KSSGRPRTSDENVARIQQAFVRSPGKSTRRASRELQLPQTTVWRFLRKSHEATFHTNGKVNRHNVRIWRTDNPRETIKHERVSPNVFCVISANKALGPFFFEGATVTGLQYLETLENWLFPQLRQEAQQFILHQMGTYLSVTT
ncbi:hypothetical protein J6590_097028, partial [Homalodisca vitripennis]